MLPDEAGSATPEVSAATPMRRYFLWGVLVAALLAVLLAAFLSRGLGGFGGARPQALPILGTVPDFELINRDGRTVHRDDLLGQPWIADFIFTRCQLSCPVITARLAEVQLRLPGDDVHLVSFSVDPEHDRPEVLEGFAEQWGAEDRWWFLTGDTDAIYHLMREGFSLGVALPADGAEANALEPISHSTKLVLVDAQGRIRGYYDGMGPDGVEQLLTDLPRLETE